MNRMSKSWVLLVAAGMLAAGRAPAAAPAKPATNTAAPAKPADKSLDLFPDPVIAKGKGVEVKRSQLDKEVIQFKAQYAARGQSVSPAQEPLLEQQKLEELIDLQLLKAKATAAERAAGKAEAEKLWQEVKTQAGSEEMLNLHLKAQGLTREELLGKWTDARIARAVLMRELKIKVTDEEVKKFYNDNPAQFEEPEMVQVRHILLSTRDPLTGKELSADQKAAKRKLAESLLKRARAGEDFAKLVKEYSEDPGSKDKGGEYTFPRASADPRRAMDPDFETAAFALKPNEISDIVTTQYGYHIIKLLERIPAKKQALAEVSSHIKDYLTQMAIQKEAKPYLEKLKKEAGVEILDEQLKPKDESDAAAFPSGHPPTKPEAKPAGKPAGK